MGLEAVPDLFPTGSRVTIYPDITGTVVAVRGQRRLVRADSGTEHEVAVNALLDQPPQPT